MSLIRQMYRATDAAAVRTVNLFYDISHVPLLVSTNSRVLFYLFTAKNCVAFQEGSCL